MKRPFDIGVIARQPLFSMFEKCASARLVGESETPPNRRKTRLRAFIERGSAQSGADTSQTKPSI